MKDLSSRLSALTPEQRALFEARLKQKSLTAPAAPQTIPRRPDADSPYCVPSIDQERLWFIDQLEPGNCAYNIFSASRIRGSLDLSIMQRVVDELVRRHETLRTTFAVIDGRPVQVIAAELRVTLEPIDLTHLPEAEREAESLRLTTEDFAAPFDLERGPLVRIGLVRLASDDHVMHVNMHHTITDRWSGAIFERETALLYEAFAEGRPSPLPPLPVQYADYSVWQRERMDSEFYREQAAFWKEELAGAPLVLEVPTDFPRPPLQNFKGARAFANYPKRLLDALKERSRREGVTMFMLALAAFKTLLYRYTGQEDVLVSSAFANRDRPELENLVGFLLNLIVFRSHLDGDPTFRELLARERTASLRAFAHQEMPFGKLVQELRPKPDASRNPVVQSSLIYLDFPELASMEEVGMTAKHLTIDNRASRFDITLAMTETPEGYEIDIEYPTDLYRPARIERMLRHLEVLLEAVAADAGRRLSQLPILTPEEERQILFEWNQTEAEYPRGACVHELFEAQAARTPEAIALEGGGEQLSYRELNERANRLARHLRAAGVGEGELVAVLLERGPEAVVALLAAFKAGAVYLPLDPQYPEQRLAFMLDDADARVLLTERRRADLPQGRAIVLALEDARAGIEAESAENFPPRASAESLAYVIYTSGSTGRPKGVGVSHASLAHTLFAARHAFGFHARDRMPVVSSFAFDISLFELFCPLLAGGAALILSNNEVLDTDTLVARLSGVTRLHAVPSLMRQIVDRAKGAGARLKLETVFVGGDAVPAALLAEMSEVFEGARINVLYGPTEATIISTTFKMEKSEGVVSIGRPLANTPLYVLDPFMNPVPVGIYGELHIGGRGLAHGYLNWPGLTAERFVPNPFSGEPGARLYRTGDLVRYGEDGSLEFAGRLDHQVKVRGFRIELGEIESELNRHEALRESVVVAREDERGDKRLVAYVVASRGASALPSTTALRNHLKERLPDYMIPSAFVFLEALPLTETGKVDRKKLPAPDRARPELESGFVAPRTPAEERVAAAFAEVLGLTRVGALDDFFELGGDSLLATQLVSRVRASFNIELPVRDIFWRPSPAELSLLIEEKLMGQLEELNDEEVAQLLGGEY